MRDAGHQRSAVLRPAESVTTPRTLFPQLLLCRKAEQKVDGIITKGPTATIIAQPTGTTSLTVQDNSVARDQLRRKRNVIISGFPESQQVSDADSLRELCVI